MSASFLICFLLLLPLFPLPAADTVIVVDPHSPGRTFEGLGALSAGASSRLLYDYPEPQRSQILDFLFKPDYGAALQHLKVEVGADVNSTDGSEPSHMRSPTDHDYTRGYEWWLMQEAARRNPAIILDILPWGAPAWIGGGHLYSTDMANYMADFIEGARKMGLKIEYTGIWNERAYDSEYVKQLKRTLNQRHLATQIVCCDNYPGEHQWKIAEDIRHDPELARSIDVLGVHYPLTEDGLVTTTHQAKISGKPLWSSEDQPNPGSGPMTSRDWQHGGRILAALYNHNYLEGALTKTEIWSPITSYYDILPAPHSGLMYANTPWSGYFDVQSTIWVTAHTTQFAQPGWQYLDSASGFLPEAGSFVTLQSPDRRQWSLIAETISATHPQTIILRSAPQTIHVWETNSAHTFDHVADLRPAASGVTVPLDPDSLYTFTTTAGQAKGSVQLLPNHPFPLPYRDDFESTPVNRAPKYLSDQDGAFEAHPCLDRAGQCLEQVITQRPIPWDPVPDPFTLAGDVNWTDYTLASDFRFGNSGRVTLLGRIDSADAFADPYAAYPSAYVLCILKTGEWTLLSTRYKQSPKTLAAGTVPLSPNAWHRFALTFHDTTITALLDGKQLIQTTDPTHTHGMIALGTSWGTAQFDNLQVSP